MNIENISALAKQLQSLGFENMDYSLLKRISFKPDSFILSQTIEKGKDKLSFQLFFKSEVKQNIYVLMYYDATLQKELTLTNAVINEINIPNLEKSMAEIDWRNAFDFTTKKQLNLDDKTSWEKEQKVESLIDDLSELEKSEDGKVLTVELKLKYWTGLPYQELLGNIIPLKNKSEISQRFYFFENQTGISVEEAYRFLQNRQLEKQMQAKRKQTDSTEIGDTKDDSQSSSGGSLLKKKRLSRSNTFNSKKHVQQ